MILRTAYDTNGLVQHAVIFCTAQTSAVCLQKRQPPVYGDQGCEKAGAKKR